MFGTSPMTRVYSNQIIGSHFTQSLRSVTLDGPSSFGRSQQQAADGLDRSFVAIQKCIYMDPQMDSGTVSNTFSMWGSTLFGVYVIYIILCIYAHPNIDERELKRYCMW